MKVLLLGSDGFVGRAVRQALAEKHTVYAASRTGETELEPKINLLDPAGIISALQTVKPEVIINCAGVVDNSEAADQNPVFTTNLLESVVTVGLKPKRIIISGSAAEYGLVDEHNIPVSEDAPLNANAGYGLSKLKETRLALEFGREHGLPVVIARIFNPVGPGMHSKFLIPRIMAQIAEVREAKRDAIEVGRLDAKRDYIDVRDVATAMVAMSDNQPAHDVYNIGSGKPTSNGELVELILNNSKLVARPAIIETAVEQEPLVAIQADITRISREFGWKPLQILEDTVKDILHAAEQ